MLSMVMRLQVSCMVKIFKFLLTKKVMQWGFSSQHGKVSHALPEESDHETRCQGESCVKVAITVETNRTQTNDNDYLLLSIFHCSFNAAKVGYHWNGQHTILCCIDNTHQKVMGGYLPLFPCVRCLYTNAVMKLRKWTWHCPFFQTDGVMEVVFTKFLP